MIEFIPSDTHGWLALPPSAPDLPPPPLSPPPASVSVHDTLSLSGVTTKKRFEEGERRRRALQVPILGCQCDECLRALQRTTKPSKLTFVAGKDALLVSSACLLSLIRHTPTNPTGMSLTAEAERMRGRGRRRGRE